jgi:transcriptional regulator with XRE-family HTH domain
MTTVSERLSQAIIESGMSYAELEKETKIAKSSIQRYATGQTKKIPVDAVQAIAKATHSSAPWILGWADKDNNIVKKNDAIADIILKLRTDDDFLKVVEGIKELSPEQLTAVKTFLSAFSI